MKPRTASLAEHLASKEAATSILASMAGVGAFAALFLAFTGCGSAVVEKANAQVTSDSTVCSVATLNGAYGLQRNGQTSQGPLTAIGIATYDGTGSGTFQQTISRNGTFTSGALQTFTYTVNSDCTSTA